MQGSKQESAEILKTLRENDGLTQQELANALGVWFSKQNISSWERDGVPIDSAFAVSDFFGVTLDYLYGKSKTKNGEAVGAVEYTGLSARAASVLHNLYSLDKISESSIDRHSDGRWSDYRTKKKAASGTLDKYNPVMPIVSNFIVNAVSILSDDIPAISLASKEMMESYKPFYGIDGKGKTDKTLQRGNIKAADKALYEAFGFVEVLKGKELLSYKVKRVSEKLSMVIAKVCKVDEAIAHCRKIDHDRLGYEQKLLEDLDDMKERGSDR